MSDEEKAPKKAARKRVVKKGVRGTRAPRKKTIAKKNDDSAMVVEEDGGEFSADENETTFALTENEPAESAAEIEVVEESEVSEEQGQSRKPASKKGRTKSQDEEPAADAGEEKSDEEGDEKSEGRNRRGRNRRGGQGREESNSKRPAIDKDEAAAKAWEIYQGELEEEGVSLVDPRRAREVARRCLELATVFCEERDRYLGK